jgi:hypothetical protein
MSKQIEAMRKMGMSEEEIADVLESDKRIDRGEKLFELDPELEKGAKKARQADRKPTVYNFQKRERKANNDKRTIINALDEALCRIADQQTEITNAEREIIFHFNGVKYKVVLSAPRS